MNSSGFPRSCSNNTASTISAVRSLTLEPRGPPSTRYASIAENLRRGKPASAVCPCLSKFRLVAGCIAGNQQPVALSSTPAVRPGAVGRGDSVRIVWRVSVSHLSSGSAFRERLKPVPAISQGFCNWLKLFISRLFAVRSAHEKSREPNDSRPQKFLGSVQIDLDNLYSDLDNHRRFGAPCSRLNFLSSSFRFLKHSHSRSVPRDVRIFLASSISPSVRYS